MKIIRNIAVIPFVSLVLVLSLIGVVFVGIEALSKVIVDYIVALCREINHFSDIVLGK